MHLLRWNVIQRMDTVWIFSMLFYFIRMSMPYAVCSAAVLLLSHCTNEPYEVCIKLIIIKIRHSAVHHFVWTKVLCSCSSSYLQGKRYTIFCRWKKILDFSFIIPFGSQQQQLTHISTKNIYRSLELQFSFCTAKIKTFIWKSRYSIFSRIS